MALQSAGRVHQMCTHAPCGLLAVAAHDRFQYVTMFFERSLETVRFEHLGAAEARHAVPQGERLLGDIGVVRGAIDRSEEHTSELQSLMRISYAVFCLKK